MRPAPRRRSRLPRFRRLRPPLSCDTTPPLRAAASPLDVSPLTDGNGNGKQPRWTTLPWVPRPRAPHSAPAPVSHARPPTGSHRLWSSLERRQRHVPADPLTGFSQPNHQRSGRWFGPPGRPVASAVGVLQSRVDNGVIAIRPESSHPIANNQEFRIRFRLPRLPGTASLTLQLPCDSSSTGRNPCPSAF